MQDASAFPSMIAFLLDKEGAAPSAGQQSG
jgi:hypothetical protein